MPGVRLALSTAPDRRTAERIARVLVEERLAACVNLVPGVSSVYRWKGRVEQDEEILLIMKTTAAGMPALRDRLLAVHPYDTPEFLALDVAAGAAPYIAWLAASVGPR